ncbi:MAG: MFS transporter [Spirochaetaceae bacterium]|nr:MFS transporter [Spirochaetaceae bacterium]
MTADAAATRPAAVPGRETAATAAPSAVQRRPLLPLSVGHFCVDSYAGMLAPMVPLLQERLGLSLAATATIGAVMAFSNLSQPLFGLLGDRLRRRNLVPAGVLLAAVCMPLMGVTASFALTLVVIAAGGLGVAAFHPQSFVIAGDLSGARRAFGIALFVFAGTVGLATTPTWLTFTVDAFGTKVLPLAALPGVAAALAIWRWVPLRADPAQDQGWRAVGAQLTASLRPLATILAVVVLRNVTFLGFNLFIAILNRDRGMGLMAGGIALSVYSLAGVLASLGVARIADRTDAKPLVWGSLAAAAPFLFAYALVPGPVSLLLLAAGGGLLGSSTSVMVALAQQAAPGQRALASSLPLGMSWGLASLTLPLLGWIADLAGVTVMLSALGWLPLVAAAIAFRFLPPRDTPSRADTPAAAGSTATAGR